MAISVSHLRNELIGGGRSSDAAVYRCRACVLGAQRSRLGAPSAAAPVGVILFRRLCFLRQLSLSAMLGLPADFPNNSSSRQMRWARDRASWVRRFLLIR